MGTVYKMGSFFYYKMDTSDKMSRLLQNGYRRLFQNRLCLIQNGYFLHNGYLFFFATKWIPRTKWVHLTKWVLLTKWVVVLLKNGYFGQNESFITKWVPTFVSK